MLTPILISIRDRLAAEVPAAKYVGFDNNQIEEGIRPSVKFPCILVNHAEVEWSSLGQNKQLGTGEFRIHIITEQLTPSSSRASGTQTNHALAGYDIERAVFLALHGWACPAAANNRMARIRTGSRAADDLLSITVTFRLNVPEDYPPLTQPLGITPTPVITTQQS